VIEGGAVVHPQVTDSRRGVELWLLIFAVGLAVAAYINVGLAVRESFPPEVLAYGLGLGVLFGAAHLVLRRFAPHADPIVLPTAAMLNGFGLVLIHRLDLTAEDSARQAGRVLPRPDAPAQLTWTAIGIALFVIFIIVVRDHRILQRYTYTAMLGGLALLALPALLPARYSEVNGARIWIRLAGFSFQPGEFAKVALITFFAGYLVVKRDVLALASRRVAGIDLPRGRDLGPVLVAWLASLGVLVIERDLGTSLLFFGAFVAMLYVATERRSWLIIGLTLFGMGAGMSYLLFGHVKTRVDVWLDPFGDPNGAGFQLVQGLYGLANGGVLGTGLGQGRPDIVPFSKTDFIVTTIGEELGLTGLMAILLLYGILVERGLRAAIAARDPFGKLLAAGLSFGLALQVFVVVGGVTKVIPLTGLTTPFLSYGGSSLVANWVIVAVLLRMSDAARRPAPSALAAQPSNAEATVGSGHAVGTL
jgi:cell division protein FtsW (lipid II flippase)